VINAHVYALLPRARLPATARIARPVDGHVRSDRSNQAPNFQGPPNTCSPVLVSSIICSVRPKPSMPRLIPSKVPDLFDHLPIFFSPRSFYRSAKPWFPLRTRAGVSDPCRRAPSPLCCSSPPDVDPTDMIHQTPSPDYPEVHSSWSQTPRNQKIRSVIATSLLTTTHGPT
jgi:hypothetical protein